MRRLRLQNAPFYKEFVKDLKHLVRIWRIGLLGHEAPEAPECFVLKRICKGFEAFEKDLADQPPEAIGARGSRMISFVKDL